MKMNTQQSFEEISKQIADSFIESIVFIDECAYKVPQSGDGDNQFDAQKVSEVFAHKGKICSIYAPQNTSDLRKIESIFQKADVVILDWRLNIENDDTKIIDLEADEEETDPRGKYTIPIIRKIVNDAGKDRLKMIVIYTGETNLIAIRDSIATALSIHGIKDETCDLQIEKVKIIIRAKEGSKEKYAHLGDTYKKLIVPYDKLPDLIVTNFALMTDGLLPNYALSAITEIRKSTSKIIGIFSKDIDPAYVGHRNLIPHPQDATEMLNEMFGTAITELIEMSDINPELWLHDWIEYKYGKNQTTQMIEIAENGQTVRIPISVEILNNIIDAQLIDQNDSRYKNIKDSTNRNYSPKKAQKHATLFFSQGGEENENKLNHIFALITQNKHLFSEITNPILTQGTVLKDKENKYYICIQPVCDCARVPTDGRNFIFLPLEEYGKIPVVLETSLCKYVDLHPYKMRVLHFTPTSADSPITSISRDNQLFFQSTEGDFQWIMTLKRIYAQRITEAFSSNLSRVGINISEWLRAKEDKSL